MFKDEQYFECDKDCAVFVALDRLFESPKDAITKPPTGATAGNDVTGGSGNKNSKNLQKQKSVEQQQKQPLFKIGDRVIAFDDGGRVVYGTVKWIGGSIHGKLIGIETVSTFIYVHSYIISLKCVYFVATYL